MKYVERNMKENIMTEHVENMKEYPLLYRFWELKKFRNLSPLYRFWDKSASRRILLSLYI